MTKRYWCLYCSADKYAG